MQFLMVTASEGERALAQVLLESLQQGQTVLWLIAGGSNIPLAVSIMKQLIGHERKLIISLTDERYGPVGHADSNWQQLLDAGFEPGEATTYPVLQTGFSLAATAQMFAMTLQDCFGQVELAVAQLGIGADGHTSGILPQSAATKPTDELAVGYETPQFNRVTTTFAALKRLNQAFCFAYGDDKRPALQNLQRELPLTDQPAQILKYMPLAYVYNDQLGE